jgi:putative PEP-CTERM system TPR-repeat lipoprotein
MISQKTVRRTAASVLAVLLALQGASSSAATDGKASRFYEDALMRYERKDIPGAIIQLKNALQIDKTMLPVQVLLGKALLANGDAVGAEVALNEALRLGVNRAEVVVPLAQAYMAQGKHRQFLDQPQFGIAGLPAGVQVNLLLLRAAASAELGDTRAAMKGIEEARVIDGRLPEVWLAEVPVRIRARQFAEAGAAVERAAALAPDSAEVRYQRGALLHVQGDLRAALAAYDAALKADSRHLEARAARAGIEVDLGRYADAAKDVAEIQAQSPREPRASYLKALLLSRDGDGAGARKSLGDVTAFLDAVPPAFIQYRPQLLMLNGLAHFGLGEYEKAKPYLESLQRVQGIGPASKLLAQIHLSDKDYVRAGDLLDEYLKRQPRDGQALLLLASVNMGQGRHAKATALMQQALAIKDAPEYHTQLGLSLLGAGQAGDATAQLETAFKDPGQIQAGTALVGLYLRDGQGGKALAATERMLKQKPDDAGLHNLAGMAQAQLGNFAAARTAFDRAVQLDDRLLEARLNQARLDIGAKAYDAAAAKLNAVLAADDKSIDAMYEMANLSDRRGQPADTLRWLSKAADAAGPREFRPALALVEFHLRNRAPDKALEVARALALRGQESVRMQMVYGRTQLINGDPEGARATFATATRYAGFDASQQTEIARWQLAAGNLAGAAYSLDKALSARPDALPALALMTEVDIRQGQPAKAEQRARQVLALAPKAAIGHSLLGDVAQSRGQGAAAVDHYRRAHQAEANSDTFRRMFVAMSLQDGGRQSLPLGETWIKGHPQDHAARRAVADAYARGGNYAAARGHYEALATVLPKDAAVLNNLANVLLRLQDPSAIAVAEQAVKADPANAHTIDTLGWALFKSGQPQQIDRALQLLRDARLREPGNPDIRYHLAEALAHSGRKTEAQDEVAAALKSSRNFESVAEAEALSKKLR